MLRCISLVALLALVPALSLGSRSRVRASGRPRGPVARTTWDSVFTAEQAARGQVAYSQSCARCHQAALGGADESPALTGSSFLSGWNGQTLGVLHERVRRSMPPDDPGAFGRQLVTDVIAYILSYNGFPAGKAELPSTDAALGGIVFVAKP